MTENKLIKDIMSHAKPITDGDLIEDLNQALSNDEHGYAVSAFYDEGLYNGWMYCKRYYGNVGKAIGIGIGATALLVGGVTYLINRRKKNKEESE